MCGAIMTKITIEFDRYEDADDLQEALNAPKYRTSLMNIYNKVRCQLKHGGIETVEEYEHFLEEILDMSYEHD